MKTKNTETTEPFALLSQVCTGLKQIVLPGLEVEVERGDWTEKQQRLIQTLESLQLDKYACGPRAAGRGRPEHDRVCILRALLAKACLAV